LAAAPDAPPATRSKALWGASWLALQQGDYRRARVRSQELLELAQAQDDPQGRRDALTGLGMAALEEGRVAEAIPPLREALALARSLGPEWRLAASVLNLGLATMHAGNLPGAEVLLQEALATFVELGDAAFAARTRHYLGYVALLAGDPAAASDQFRQSLQAAWARQEPTGIVEGLEAVAAAGAATGRDVLAARLAGVVAAWRDETGVAAHAFDRAVAERYLDASRRTLGDAVWDAAWSDGRRLPMAMAVQRALHGDDESAPPARPHGRGGTT
jgi:tetratricopeptide (TPR) repeat protein